MHEKIIGGCRLILGDSLQIMSHLPRGHIITDAPYESILHNSKNKTFSRNDHGPVLKPLDFDAVDDIRPAIVDLSSKVCDGWFITFCTIEGVAKWADEINASVMKYKRACTWIKRDAPPQFNGQGPAQGVECFVVAWNGSGHARWNAGGKRGIYDHLTNSKDRTGLHATEKPLSLMKEIIADFTNPGDLVIDPFMGVATTLSACAQMGRRGIGIEINPTYYELACKRVEEAYRQPSFEYVERVKAKQEKLF